MQSIKSKKYIKLAKGYFGRAKSCKNIAKERVLHGLVYSKSSRKKKSANARQLHMQHINAFVRPISATNYSTFIGQLRQAGSILNIKMCDSLIQREAHSALSCV